MNKAVLIVFSLFLFSACSTLKKSSSSALPYKSNTFLVKKSQQNNLNYQWFSAKMSGTVFVNEKAIPLNANIRMQKDSVIWISATALLGIEAVRLLITPDSFKMINRLNSTYISSDISTLSNRFGVNFSFYELQNKLLGDLDLEQLKWKSTSDSANYILANTTKGKQTQATLNPSFFAVQWSQDQLPKNSMLLNYSNFTSFEQGSLPLKVSLNIKQEEKKMRLKYSYSKIVLDQKKKVKFTIPKGYEPAL
tara:strand:- start:601 stop:1350 length:750 start_codon:yes stop_codon:yes gene_type:complete